MWHPDRGIVYWASRSGTSAPLVAVATAAASRVPPRWSSGRAPGLGAWPASSCGRLCVCAPEQRRIRRVLSFGVWCDSARGAGGAASYRARCELARCVATSGALGRSVPDSRLGIGYRRYGVVTTLVPRVVTTIPRTTSVPYHRLRTNTRDYLFHRVTVST